MTPDQDIAFTEFLCAKSQEAEALSYPPSYFRHLAPGTLVPTIISVLARRTAGWPSLYGQACPHSG